LRELREQTTAYDEACRMTLPDAETADRTDPFAPWREKFVLPEGVIYLDGNSLGALPRTVPERMARVVAEEWGRDLITSWNKHDWIDLPRRVGDKIGRLIGAAPSTVVAADSTSVNIFKLLAVALARRPGRKVILTEEGNFPTDVYIAGGLASLVGQGHEVRLAPASGLAHAIDESVAVVLLTEVNYRTGAKLDMAALTRRAHEVGALIIWDLCHSAGAMPVDLAGTDADFAVGCGYKYLNGGPGAPAFAYVAPRHHDGLRQPLSGWLGHAAPFDFAADYRPAAGADALRAGTPPILSMSALDAALDVFDGVDLAALKAKADALNDLFLGTIRRQVPHIVSLTPGTHEHRGSQINLRHPEAYAVMQALIGRGVVGDFRQPDIMRFGFAPLYLSYAEVQSAAMTLCQVIAGGEWDRPALKRRAKVV
jgi:kynureninase